MRILQYHPDMLAGESGPATAARGWMAALATIGVPSVAIVDRDAMRLPSPKGTDCVTLRHRGRGGARIPVGLRKVLREDDLLVLHGGWLVRNAVAGLAASRRQVPFVVNAHAVYDPNVLESHGPGKRLWAAAVERRLLERALAVQLFFAREQEGLDRLGVRVPTIVAPNGIGPSRERWDGGSGGYLLWLGRYAPRHKGLDLLLAAMARLSAAERPGLRLHGPDWRGQRGAIRSLIARLGLGPWVTAGDAVHGRDKERLVSRAVGCVYPSRWEGCSMSVLESIAAGVPTLVAPYPMGRSLGQDGAAIEADWSPDGLADGLRRLTDPAAAEVGARGAEVARTRFSWPALARSWIAQAAALDPRVRLLVDEAQVPSG
jgi:glycosyltransferase involved in cell wall biosynthesis